ncbi:MAG TPA: SDR family oxidoreductase [Terriglobia bacterium]|nr:SDR family oxidoreductase [Terriglobia bacterium]
MAQQSPLTDAGPTFQENEILLTGGNGFLGKVILAMLLERYPQVKHVHLLLRPGKGLSAEERFKREIMESPVMAALLATRGEKFVEERISIWPGELSQPACGLDQQALSTVTSRVKLIINCAGKVEFFPPVDESLRANVDGVENAIALARSAGARLLHVSTCFVSGEANGLIEETEPILGFYPHRKGAEDSAFDALTELAYCREQVRLITASAVSDETEKPQAPSKEAAQKLVALGKRRAEHWGWVNTYTYSKSLGEQLIAREKDLPWSIVRPAIVESALRFPFPGWIEGGRTAAPLVLMAMGGLKHWPVSRNTPLEVVPVDLVAAAVLAVGALLLKGRADKVYQLGTADVNPIKLGALVDLLRQEARKRSSRNGKARLPLRIAASRGRARFISLEQARARRQRTERRIQRAQVILDRMHSAVHRAGLPGKQSLAAWQSALRTLGLQARFREQTLDQYLPFILHNHYVFESENIRTAYQKLSQKDRMLLPWDPERIHWKKYWVHHQIEGIEKWIQPEAVKDWSFKI